MGAQQADSNVPAIKISGLEKFYDNGFKALTGIDLEIEKGEIFALLGPNGAGKTTLIGIVCGLVNASAGTVEAGGFNVAKAYRKAREKIGLVPQELTVEAFVSVWATVRFSRRLFGKANDDAYLEKLLKTLSLWDKRDVHVRKLSGGMKRRLLIAKALSHEPEIIFLDEPTAGVDVALRKDMWQVVRKLRETGVTIVLTTHYIEEAEEMADRVGIILKGELVLVENKMALLHKLGRKTLTLELEKPLNHVPDTLAHFNLELVKDGNALAYTYSPQLERSSVPLLLRALAQAGINYSDLKTKQSSLEDIFVDFIGPKESQRIEHEA